MDRAAKCVTFRVPACPTEALRSSADFADWRRFPAENGELPTENWFSSTDYRLPTTDY
jgi:hypothetical protein